MVIGDNDSVEEDVTKKNTDMEEENKDRILTVRERNWNQFFEEAASYFENGFASSTILQKHQLKYGVTTIMSLLKINSETPTVIGNYMMENTSFNMMFGGEIVPKLETNNDRRNVLLINQSIDYAIVCCF